MKLLNCVNSGQQFLRTSGMQLIDMKFELLNSSDSNR